nr:MULTISPECIES: tetratricopeptide repeat protein [unclassified Limnothrix]
MPEDWLRQVSTQHQLSPEQTDALIAVMQSESQTTEKIAATLGISASALKMRMGGVYEKLGITGASRGKLYQLKRYLWEAYQNQETDLQSHQLTSSPFLKPEQSSQPLLVPDRVTTEPPTNLGVRGVASDRFFGRDQELMALHEQLQGHDHRVAIASVDGMGGVGKTELAVQYARSHLNSYRGGVVWLAGERAGIELLNFARSHFFPNLDLSDLGDLPEQLAYCFAQWPAKEVPPELVLLIFDDVTDYRTQVEAILPADARFRVLITTRAKFQGIARLELQVLTPVTTLQLLESIVGTERIAAERATAEALCEWLGFLPLGIELVGYYLRRKAELSLATMQERLEAQRLQARAIDPKDRDFPEGMTARYGVTEAFELSWEELEPAAQRLAVLLGCFGPAPVLWDWVLGCLPNDDEEDIEDARDQLVKLSLVKAEEGQYALHPLIREFFAAKRAAWPEGGALQQAFLGQMVSVAKTVPRTVTLADLARTRPAWSHLEAAAAASGEITDPTDSMWVFSALAQLAEGQGLWAEAEQHWSDCLSITESRFGPNHHATATSLNNLALLYKSQGRYEAAESLVRRALEICEQALGANHPDTALSLNNLAYLYYSQGQYEETESLVRRALEICERALGADHPNTATSLNNLAELYYSQGRYEEAEPLYRRALEIREQVLGANHPDTVLSLNDLAALYKSQGRYEAAEPLYQRSLEICEQVLGADHPLTATSLNDLAALYKSQGRYKEAEPLVRRSLEIREQVLGADHPDSAASLNNLALLYESQGRYKEAEPLYRRALEIYEQVLGADHPDTATSLHNLAGLYESQGRYKEAEPLYRRSLEIREQVLGADHPDSAASLDGLAYLYYSQGRYEEAEPLYRRALEIYEKVLGANHPDIATSLNNLALLYQGQKHYKKAEPLYRQALEICEQVLGADHPDTATSLNNLAVLHYYQHRWGEAERMLVRALEIRVQKLGKAHPHTQSSIQSLQNLVQAVIKADRAADLSNHPLTQSILQQLTTPPNP